MLARKAFTPAAIAGFLQRDERIIRGLLERLGVPTVQQGLTDLEDSKAAMPPRKISKIERQAVQEECQRLELPIARAIRR